ncbi:MAG TPA: carboxylesterase family protein, partial [Xanthomonadales bacterium]|nr:carboxylesterase family protein [Xanthomonadales bacterium]
LAYHYALSEILTEPALATLESFHGLDIVLLFGDLSLAQPAVRSLGERMQRMWVDFAYGREPGASDAIAWPRYQTPGRQSLELNSARTAVLDDYRRDQCEFWSSFLVL